MKLRLIQSHPRIKILALIITILPAAVYAESATGSDFLAGLLGAVGISGGLNIFGNIFGAPNIGEVIMNVIKFILGILGAATILAIIVGGLRYVMSGGNEQQIEGAKKTLLYAIIGFVVVILAYTIVTFIDRVILH
jgi:hypothetical protein